MAEAIILCHCDSDCGFCLCGCPCGIHTECERGCFGRRCTCDDDYSDYTGSSYSEYDLEDLYENHIDEAFGVSPLWDYFDYTYRNRIKMAYHLFESDFRCTAKLFIPPFNITSEEEDDDMFLLQNLAGRARVYRYGEGWVHIKPIHLYGPLKFHPPCHMPCELCRELELRFMNFRVGVYDYLNSQITGICDDIQLDDDVSTYIQAHSISSIDMVQNTMEVPTHVWGNDGVLSVDEAVGWLVQGSYDTDDVQEEDVQQATFGYDKDYCCPVCHEDIEQLTGTVNLGCHRLCDGCFELMGSADLENRFKCPMCRRPFQVGTIAEGKIQYNVSTEYVATDSLGELDFDDPVPYYQVVERSGHYQVLIVSGILEKDQRLEIQGNIKQVKDLLMDVALVYATPNYSFSIEGKYEIEIIAFDRLPDVRLIDDVVYCDHKEKILVFTLGTYGDVRPSQLVTDKLKESGYDARLVGPNNYEADYKYDWSAIENLYRERPQAIPNMDLIKHQPVISEMMVFFEQIIREFKPDRIVSTPMMPGSYYLSKKFDIPIYYFYCIPNNEGAYVYTEQNTPWKKWFCKAFEQIVCSLTSITPMIKDYVHGDGPIFWPHDQDMNIVYTIAPEIYSNGVGNLILQQPENIRYNYSVFFGIGSMSSKKVEDEYVDLLSQLEDSVLFQSQYRTGTYRNITFIGKCNHEDVFRDIPVVVCHGGSGTLQTALRHGCRVLVHPFWVDQKYWPQVCDRFNVQLCKEGKLFLQQILSFVRLGRLKYRASGVTVAQLTNLLIGRFGPLKSKKTGLFVFSESIQAVKGLSMIERLIWGDSRSEHVGLGHMGDDGIVRYIELSLDGAQLHIKRSIGNGLDSSISHYRFVDGVYDEDKFTGLIPEHYTLSNNCRTIVDNYFILMGIDFSLYKWHEERKRVIVQGCTGSRRINISDIPLGSILEDIREQFKQRVGDLNTFVKDTYQLVDESVQQERVRTVVDKCVYKRNEIKFLDYPHSIFKAPADGDCLYHCVSRALFKPLKEIKDKTFVRFKQLVQEYDLGTQDQFNGLPYFTTVYGDILPLSVAEAFDLRLAITTMNKEQYVTIVNDLGGKTLYLRLNNDHYDMYEFDPPKEDYEGYQIKGDTRKVSIGRGVHFPSEVRAIPKEDVEKVIKKMVHIAKERKLGVGTFRKGNADVMVDFPFHVLKVTCSPNNSPREMSWQVGSSLVILMKKYYDDGLPLCVRHIRWPHDSRYGELTRCGGSDPHRGNFCSFGGVAIPIDQHISVDYDVIDGPWPREECCYTTVDEDLIRGLRQQFP